MSIETSNSLNENKDMKKNISVHIPTTPVPFDNNEATHADDTLEQQLDTLADPDILNKLTTWKFTYEYLIKNKDELIKIWHDTNNPTIINNIKKVVSVRINEYLKPYWATIHFDPKDHSSNFAMGEMKFESSLFIDPSHISVEQPKDLQSVVCFPYAIDIFDLTTPKRPPIIAHNWDIVEFKWEWLPKTSGVLIIQPKGVVEVISWSDRSSWWPNGILKILSTTNH